ncbi:MAG: Tyrosine--tRNA ligase [Chlamydiae bacterium]|nr:Tyrosine--tRNA ligase [Chlamydiota bacterium]
MSNVIECLKERGFIDAVTSKELEKVVEKPIKLYLGFDPTAESLHLGNFVGMMALAWFQRFGHTPVVLIGGATGKIGDPSGKSKERPLLSAEVIQRNVAQIRNQFESVLDFAHPTAPPVMIDNDSWLGSLNLIEFLRDVGKHFRMGPMLGKEMVRTRLESEDGLSFTEFSYQMIQAYDYYHLFSSEEVVLQLGGSDQWGNITAGIEFIRKRLGKTAYGLTWPLLTRSDGKKFGKSESGAIWLDPEMCSPYQLYQYLYGIPDSDVTRMMRMITFMEMEEIREFQKRLEEGSLQPNEAQKRLAEEVTRSIHGESGLETALKVTKSAIPGGAAVLDGAALREISSDMPSISLGKQEIFGIKYTELAVKSGLLASKGEAARLIKNGGAYLNNDRVNDPALEIEAADLIDGEFLLLGAGKKKKVLVRAL